MHDTAWSVQAFDENRLAIINYLKSRTTVRSPIGAEDVRPAPAINTVRVRLHRTAFGSMGEEFAGENPAEFSRSRARPGGNERVDGRWRKLLQGSPPCGEKANLEIRGVEEVINSSIFQTRLRYFFFGPVSNFPFNHISFVDTGCTYCIPSIMMQLEFCDGCRVTNLEYRINVPGTHHQPDLLPRLVDGRGRASGSARVSIQRLRDQRHDHWF